MGLEKTNGSLVGEDKWFPCWRGPMVPLLERTNGSLVGEDMALLLERTNGSLIGEDQWFPCWRGPMVALLGKATEPIFFFGNGLMEGKINESSLSDFCIS